ncbi:tail fiber protein [Bartonella sp. WD12.1]|uniref:tail fiber protein n=1 Tax=Bartonella sp. WD12.1 TaxID=1933903 RepID=UPI0023E7FF79|nr:tail fiber protein [Bartonella sp. WD12.1]
MVFIKLNSQNIFQDRNFPVWFIATFAMQALPNDWLLCDSASYERKKYLRLFKAIDIY